MMKKIRDHNKGLLPTFLLKKFEFNINVKSLKNIITKLN